MQVATEPGQHYNLPNYSGINKTLSEGRKQGGTYDRPYFFISKGAANHYVLTSDANGNGVWADPYTTGTTTWTTTTDFDGGTKSASSGNYEVETATDNGGITANELVLGNMKGDMFNYADADGLTWKWEHLATPYWGLWSNFGTTDIDTTISDTYYTSCTRSGTSGGKAVNVKTQVTGDFDVRVTLNQTANTASDNRVGMLFLVDSTAGSWDGVELWKQEGTTDRIWARSYVANSQTNNSYSTTDKTISLRIVRSGSTVTCYYDLAGGDSWTLLHTKTGFSTAAGDLHMLNVVHGTNGTSTCEFSNFKFNSVAFDSGAYRASGSWLSDAYTYPAVTYKHADAVSITLDNASATEYVDKVELIDAADGTTVLATSTDNIITDGANIVANWDTDLWTISENLQVKVYLAGTGTDSVQIEGITLTTKYL